MFCIIYSLGSNITFWNRTRVSTPLGGKATTKTPIEVITDSNTSVQLLDKDGRVIGSGTTGANGRVTICFDWIRYRAIRMFRVIRCFGNHITFWNRTSWRYSNMSKVITDPNTNVQLLDKDNNVIGSGTTGANGHVTITPTRPSVLVVAFPPSGVETLGLVGGVESVALTGSDIELLGCSALSVV
jgi:uncharacterized protein YfaS (alpha-2-macroglobulin family)